MQEKYNINGAHKDSLYAAKHKDLIYEIKNSNTNLSKEGDLENTVVSCGCPPCGCTNLTLLVLSPAGIAAAAGVFVAFSPIN